MQPRQSRESPGCLTVVPFSLSRDLCWATACSFVKQKNKLKEILTKCWNICLKMVSKGVVSLGSKYFWFPEKKPSLWHVFPNQIS